MRLQIHVWFSAENCPREGYIFAKNQQQTICHCYIGVGYAQTKKYSNPSYFLEGGHFWEISGWGEFFETDLFLKVFTLH